MDKEKEIVSELSGEIAFAERCGREQAEQLGYTDFRKTSHIFQTIAQHLAHCGYRKADEVRKETAKEIWNKLYQKADNTCNNRLNLNKQDIRFFAAQDGVEVDE